MNILLFNIRLFGYYVFIPTYYSFILWRYLKLIMYILKIDVISLNECTIEQGRAIHKICESNYLLFTFSTCSGRLWWKI